MSHRTVVVCNSAGQIDVRWQMKNRKFNSAISRGSFKLRQAGLRRSQRRLQFELFEPRYLLASAPIALVDSYSVTENAALDVLAKGVLANDSDADGDALTARLVAGPSHGTLTLRPDGSFAYTPTTGYVGTDRFTYKANDGLLDSAAAAVSIDVSIGPAVRTGLVSGVTNQTWTRVVLDHGYKSMVVVATPSYSVGGTPLIARIRNATGNSFEVSVDRAAGTTRAVPRRPFICGRALHRRGRRCLLPGTARRQDGSGQVHLVSDRRGALPGWANSVPTPTPT